MGYMEVYKSWCDNMYFDEATRAELKSIANDEKEIEDRFYKDLEFGTGGLRGVIGNGTNRMNIYTVRKATQGLANFIIKEGAADRGVAIAFDSRRMSPEFADEAALCLNANGIKAYIFPSLRPTPELSFALRDLNCIAGIVVTASHNPPEYNGYKVYWEDGAQITAPKDTQIITEVNNVTDFNSVKIMDKCDAQIAGLYNVIGADLDDKYISQLKKMIVNPEAIKEVADDIKIVYTPLHGTGNIPARRVLHELGFHNVYAVPEQAKPDSEFSTVSYPNPEDPKAFTLALKLAKEKDADIIEDQIDKISALSDSIREANEDLLMVITRLQEQIMTIRQNILEKQRTLSNLLRSELMPTELHPKLSMILRDVNSLMEHANIRHFLI